MDIENKAVSGEESIPASEGKYSFRKSDTGGSILMVTSEGQYIDVNIDNCGFLGSVSLFKHLTTAYGIYVVCNPHTNLFEAFRMQYDLLTQYRYEDIEVLFKLVPVKE